MKHLILYLLSATCWLACTSRKEPVGSPQSAITIYEDEVGTPGIPDRAIRRSLVDIPVNSKALSLSKQSAADAILIQTLRGELMQLDPVPVPQSNAELPISIAEADKRYRSFVSDHQGEPLLGLFQQYFPRILLNKYGIINGTDYALIRYYTEQLVAAESFDFVTLASALSTLRPHVQAEQFDRLVSQVNENARSFYPEHKRHFDQLKADMMDTSGVDEPMKRFLALEREQILPRMQADEQTLDRALAQLEQMQSKRVN